MICTANYHNNDSTSRYRYALSFDWSDEQELFVVNPARKVLFLMLNPSTATQHHDDPTVAKCRRLAARWQFTGLEVRNLFALRATNPDELRHANDPIGPLNDDAILSPAVWDEEVQLIVCAWGNHGRFMHRSANMRLRLRELVVIPVVCFKLSVHGEPEHPLYQRECELADMLEFKL